MLDVSYPAGQFGDALDTAVSIDWSDWSETKIKNKQIKNKNTK